MKEMQVVGRILKTFPGSRLVPTETRPPDMRPAPKPLALTSPPLVTPTPPLLPPMSGDFFGSCDYCGQPESCRWVYDREQDEDRVACGNCRDQRGFDTTPDRRLARD